jgi:hypothetical protein
MQSFRMRRPPPAVRQRRAEQTLDRIMLACIFAVGFALVVEVVALSGLSL